MLHYHKSHPSPAVRATDRVLLDDAPGRAGAAPSRAARRLRGPAPNADCVRAALDAVGPMTRYGDHTVLAGQRMIDVRFRPGRWSRVLATPGERVVDAIVPLEDLWGFRGRSLLERLANTRSAEECARAIESALPRGSEPEPVERAVAFLQRAGGCVGIDDLARHAGLSARQFRQI